MNLDELRNTLASDATKENERLKTEISLLREHLRDSQNDYEALKKFMTSDWTLTRGAMCIFCELDAFKCPHAMSDNQKIQVAKKMMEESNNA